MAEKELRIKVVIVDDEAKRQLDDLERRSRRVQMSAGEGGSPRGARGGDEEPAGAAGSASRLMKRVGMLAAGAVGAGGAINAIGGGYGLENARTALSAGWDELERAVGRLTGMVDEAGVNQFNARTGAIQRGKGDLAGMLGSAPDVSAQQIESLLRAFARIYTPGQRNLQRLEQAEDRIVLEETAKATRDLAMQITGASR